MSLVNTHSRVVRGHSKKKNSYYYDEIEVLKDLETYSSGEQIRFREVQRQLARGSCLDSMTALLALSRPCQSAVFGHDEEYKV